MFLIKCRIDLVVKFTETSVFKLNRKIIPVYTMCNDLLNELADNANGILYCVPRYSTGHFIGAIFS